MLIKPRHKHVDAQGLIYMPYLHTWNAQSASLLELVLMMSSTFRYFSVFCRVLSRICRRLYFVLSNNTGFYYMQRWSTRFQANKWVCFASWANTCSCFIDCGRIFEFWLRFETLPAHLMDSSICNREASTVIARSSNENINPTNKSTTVLYPPIIGSMPDVALQSESRRELLLAEVTRQIIASVCQTKYYLHGCVGLASL